jgi:hypothetical protein
MWLLLIELMASVSARLTCQESLVSWTQSSTVERQGVFTTLGATAREHDAVSLEIDSSRARDELGWEVSRSFWERFDDELTARVDV